jgi:hypothetical protein
VEKHGSECFRIIACPRSQPVTAASVKGFSAPCLIPSQPPESTHEIMPLTIRAPPSPVNFSNRSQFTLVCWLCFAMLAPEFGQHSNGREKT